MRCVPGNKRKIAENEDIAGNADEVSGTGTLPVGGEKKKIPFSQGRQRLPLIPSTSYTLFSMRTHKYCIFTVPERPCHLARYLW